VNQARPPQVLLGNLEPIMAVGLERVLAEDGIDVIGQEPNPSRIVVEAGRLQPDAVLLDRGDIGARTLSRQVQDVAPRTKVILWARDETVMEVLDPASDRARLVALTAHGELRSELTSARHRQRVEE
jgi:DNA-binding NarL/FixJ family response regulator